MRAAAVGGWLTAQTHSPSAIATNPVTPASGFM
jgi:hypothetical protein